MVGPDVEPGEIGPVRNGHGGAVEHPIVDVNQHRVPGVRDGDNGVGATSIGHVRAHVDAVHDQPHSEAGPRAGDPLVGVDRSRDEVFEPEDVVAAVDGIGRSDWHMR
jgi:hypothetical protein